MDHSSNTLTAAIKSLTDGVQPAVDTTDPLATQQLGLVKDYLGFLQQRLPYLHVRATIELRAATRLGESLAGIVADVDPEAEVPLKQAVARAQDVHIELAPLTELEDATAAVLAVVREVVRSAASAPAEARHTVERLVLEDGDTMSSFYRAWYLPLGFDPYPDEVPALPDALRDAV